VVFGRGREHEVIEVSTFRALLGAESAEQVEGNEKTSRAELAGKTHVVDASGRVLRDNVWGPQIEDAARRDFTVNAMYYDPVTRTVVDYHGGFADVRARVLRMIGDPATRYREDPVRLLRVARFVAKLGFTIEPKTLQPVQSMAASLTQVPGSRLFDEMIKLLQTGHAISSLEVLQRLGLVQGIFPVLEAALDGGAQDARRKSFIDLALQDTDRRVGEGKPVAPSFMLACLLWHEVLGRWTALKEAGESPFPALQQAIDAVFEARIGDISGRGKLAADMREIWQMQPRLERRTVSSAPGMVEQPRFRAGFDFLRLRADVGEVPQELAEWWEDFSLGTPEEREALLDALKASQTRRVPGARKSGGGARDAASHAGSSGESGAARAGTGGGSPQAASLDTPGSQEEADGEVGDSPERKRRRRRRRGGRGPGSGEASGPASES
jgi:poly(A) polymerase